MGAGRQARCKSLGMGFGDQEGQGMEVHLRLMVKIVCVIRPADEGMGTRDGMSYDGEFWKCNGSRTLSTRAQFIDINST